MSFRKDEWTPGRIDWRCDSLMELMWVWQRLLVSLCLDSICLPRPVEDTPGEEIDDI